MLLDAPKGFIFNGYLKIRNFCKSLFGYPQYGLTWSPSLQALKNIFYITAVIPEIPLKTRVHQS